MGVKNIIGELQINGCPVLANEHPKIPDNFFIFTEYTNDDYIITGFNSIQDFSYYDLIIPSSYNGKPVVAIGSSAFYGLTECNNIHIPETIKEIYDYAFRAVTFNAMKLHSTFIILGEYIFRDCRSAVKIYCTGASLSGSGINSSWNYINAATPLPVLYNCAFDLFALNDKLANAASSTLASAEELVV